MKFENLNLIEPLLKAVDKEGYIEPTPIQAQSIPAILRGSDVLGCAQTGTGKTATYALPIIQLICETKKKDAPANIQALILVPSRELAIQVGNNISTYSQFTKVRHAVLYGGVKQDEQIIALRHGVEIVIATPGRLMDLMGQGHVYLGNLRFLVLDEVDKLLDMGLNYGIESMLPSIPETCQYLFFSATIPSEIEQMAGRLMNNPVKVMVSPSSLVAETIDQYVYFVEKENRIRLLKTLMKQPELESVLIFTRMKAVANKLAHTLRKIGIEASAFHSSFSQQERHNIMEHFKTHSLRVLVATDIASRGIDVENLTHVINYEVPKSPMNYVHHVGRTGRAGRYGVAITFCVAEDVPFLLDIQKLLGEEICAVGREMFDEATVKAAVKARKEANKQKDKEKGIGNKVYINLSESLP